ncbi:unnamed protein product, partial [Ixodes pacificus]
MDPPVELGFSISPGWFYNQSLDLCQYDESGAYKLQNEESNRFSSLSECSKTCRSPDFGPCAQLPSELYCKYDGTEYYRYNLTTQTCYRDRTLKCKGGKNAFLTLNACYARCGSKI